MSIHKKTFFDFRSTEQREREYQEYQEYMFPLGDDHRACIANALSHVPKKCAKEKLMFLFLVTKERYLECQMEDRAPLTCCMEAYETLRKYVLFSDSNLPYIFSLVLLDLKVTSLESYPQAEQITAQSRDLFPAGPKKPDWSRLS